MDELLWAVEEARKWTDVYGGHADGLARQMDGRWFLRVITREENWCPVRNLFITREADLGRFPTEEEAVSATASDEIY